MARKQLFRSTLAGQTAALALAVAWGAMVPLAVGRDGKGIWSLHLNVALAERGRGGGDSGGSSGSGGGGDSDGGGSGGRSSGGGSSGGSSGGHDGSGSGSGGGSGSSGGSDDGGGSGSSGGDDGTGTSHDAGDGSGSSRHGTSGSDDSGTSGRSGGTDDRDGPRAKVEISDSDVAAVMRGERVLVDDRGRVLEVEVEHGVRTVTVKPHGSDARRNPGPIGKVRTVDITGQTSRSVIAHPVAGGFELEVEHGAAVPNPHGGASPAAVPAAGRSRDPVQVGDDLSPEQEADLIRGGWR